MKSKLFIFLLFLMVVAIVTQKQCLAGNSYVWAEKYDAMIDGFPADHTYTAIQRAFSPVYKYSYYGGNSGGSYLSGTFGITDNLGDTRVRCIANYKPTYCKVSYLREGVCHQDTNRALYPVGLGSLTVKNARGYFFFKKKFNTYGSNSYAWKWSMCRQQCWYSSGW